MRTTLDLPQPLLEEAMRLSPERTKTATIVAALDAQRRPISQGAGRLVKGLVESMRARRQSKDEQADEKQQQAGGEVDLVAAFHCADYILQTANPEDYGDTKYCRNCSCFGTQV